MEEKELPHLEHHLKGIFERYESTLTKYGIPKEVRHEIAQSLIRYVFYHGATNELNDWALRYKDPESQKEEEAKIDKKINAFEEVLNEYLTKKK